MSANGKGDPKEDVIEFDALDVEDDKDDNKVTQMLTFLKEKLSDEDYTSAMEFLGVKTELSAEQLLEAILLELRKKEKPEDDEDKNDKKKKKPDEDKEDLAKKKEDEYEYPDDKTKKGADPSYKDFMRKCMDAGKSMTECAKEYKEKYPEPSKKEEAEFADALVLKKKKKDEDEDEDKKKEANLELDAVKKEMAELKLDLARIKEEKRLAEISHTVDKQVEEKHLAPIQRDKVIKLMAKMDDDLHEEFLGTYSSQKFRGFEDVGRSDLRKPGEPETLDEETRKRISKEFGLDELIEEKAMKKRSNN